MWSQFSVEVDIGKKGMLTRAQLFGGQLNPNLGLSQPNLPFGYFFSMLVLLFKVKLMLTLGQRVVQIYPT